MKWPWLLFLPVTVAIVTGCSLVSPLPPPPKKALIEKAASDVPRRNSSRLIILIAVPEAEPVFDTTRMAYKKEAYELSYFNEYEWAEKPAKMIQGVLVNTLQSTHYFRQVMVPPDFSGYDYMVNSRILALTQDFTSTPPVLRAAIRVQLVSAAEHQVVAAKDISSTEPIAGQGPYEGVVAANDAVETIMRDVALFVLEATGGATASVTDGGQHPLQRVVP